MRLGREQWIYVNSLAAVKEIFDKQSQYSSRAPSPVVSDIFSGGLRCDEPGPLGLYLCDFSDVETDSY